VRKRAKNFTHKLAGSCIITPDFCCWSLHANPRRTELQFIFLLFGEVYVYVLLRRRATGVDGNAIAGCGEGGWPMSIVALEVMMTTVEI